MDLFWVFNQGWFGIIAGAAIGVLLYRRAQRDPRISYQVSTQTLIAGVPQSLKGRVAISIDGMQTDDLLSTRLVLWNSGNAVVTSNSFPVGGGLLLRPDVMANIVGFDILTATNPINGVTLVGTEVGISIRLSYLNPGDGAIVDILHTSQAGKIRLEGILLGQQRGVLYEGKISTENSTRRTFRTPTKDMFDGFILLSGGAICLLIGFEYWSVYSSGATVISKTMSPQHHFNGAIMMYAFGLLAILIGLIFLVNSRRHPPRRIALPEN